MMIFSSEPGCDDVTVPGTPAPKSVKETFTSRSDAKYADLGYATAEPGMQELSGRRFPLVL